jgi:bifunctional non-homologous end joining protein LigD
MAAAKKKSAVKVNPASKRAARRARKSSDASDAVDEQLARYQSMRDFSVTHEPRGNAQAAKSKPGEGLPFVIQKHAASHLHYDFRLGWNGVLKSWACAKGPSYSPADRRLAVQVEDHPMEYGGFEGIIPAGQYGGGTVMLWDQGTWAPQPGHTDVDAGLRDGSLKFTLDGAKMKGKWTLVRMGGRAANEKKPNWLLIKEHDEFERGPKDKAVTEEAPDSVVTGRSLEEIAASEDHVWNSRDTAKGNAWHRKGSEPGKRSKSSTVAKAKPLAVTEMSALPVEVLPGFVAPQLASEATVPPSGSGWLHELKLDGYRVECRLQAGKATLLTRSGLDWTDRMRAVAEAAAKLPANSALLDGELVVLREDGTTSFADLQAAFQDASPDKRGGGNRELTYFAFDLLHLNGRNLRDRPLAERKSLLAGLLQSAGETIRISEAIEADAARVFEKACELGAEGVVSKRADSRYTSGRSSSWLKLKCVHEQEFVVGGFTLPAKGHATLHGVGSLLLGYYGQRGELIYAGRTGTGFTRETHNRIRTQLDAMRRSTSPFHEPPPEARKAAIWVRPSLVAQVRFANWTADNLLRQAAFQGLREDKLAKEVRREEAIAMPRNGSPTARRASQTGPALIAAKIALPPRKRLEAPPSTIRLTHPEKILDVASQLTKQQLADYYWAIAPHMLPEIEGRPLSLVRCPEGSTKPCFFQKHSSAMLPPGVESVEVRDKKTGKSEPYITLATAEALTSLAQMGVLEVHPWGSRNIDLEHPDRIVIDLDPDAAINWKVLAAAAVEIGKRLKSAGLESFLKSTGGKGLHVVVPIVPERDWNTVKQFAHAFVLELERDDPSLFLTKMTKSARAGKIYLDYLRNERGATAIAAFSPRARTGAPVAVPLRWSELKLESPPEFHVADYPAWKGRLASQPWKKLGASRQRLTSETLVRYKAH